MRWIRALLAAFIVAAIVGLTAPVQSADPTFFFFLLTKVATGEQLTKWQFDRPRVADESGGPGGSIWTDGDRVAYHTGYAFLEHEDPGVHDFLKAFRFFIQVYGATGLQLNDKYMVELNPQGGPPYPYEPASLWSAIPPDLSRPGGKVQIFHVRQFPCAFCGEFKNRELLRTFIVPAVDPLNPKVRWYYQLGSLFVAVHSDLGIIARLIFSSMDPFYDFTVSALP